MLRCFVGNVQLIYSIRTKFALRNNRFITCYQYITDNSPSWGTIHTLPDSFTPVNSSSSSMIIAESVDNSDAASITTLVTKGPEKMPRFFAGLTYSSLFFTVFPFSFALINVLTTRLYTIPTIIAYVITTPFHVGALLIIWQHNRQIDMQLPFNPTTWRNMIHIIFLMCVWLTSFITSSIGARELMERKLCWDSERQMVVTCDQRNYARTATTFITSALLSAFEVLLLTAILIICYRSRPREEAPVEIPLSRTPSPKAISVWYPM